MRAAKAERAAVYERRAHRYQVNIDASIMGDDGRESAVRVVNLSRRGFGAETDGSIAADSTVTLTLPGVCHAKARIVWSDRGSFGAEFLAPQRLYLIPEVIEQAGGAGFPEV
jgi:hypothetical protein